MASPLWNQIWMISGIFMNSIANGSFLVYIIYLTVALIVNRGNKTDRTNALHLDVFEGESIDTISKIIHVAPLIGTIMSSILMKHLGRRRTFILFIVLGNFSLLILYFAKNASSRLAGFFFNSLSSGGTLMLGPIVISEFSSPRNRGIFILVIILATTLGFLVGLMFSFFTHPKVQLLFELAFQFLALSIVCFWTESPLWLCSKRRFEESEKSFYKLRGDSAEACKELTEMINTYKSFDIKPKTKLSISKKVAKFLLRFTASNFLDPLVIILAANVLLVITGMEFAKTFMPVLLYHITGRYNDYSGMASVLSLLVIVASIILVRFMKRRTLIFSSGTAAFVTLILMLMTLCFLNTNHPEAGISLVIIYFVLSGIGCAPLSIILIGELFPSAHKGVGSAASGISIFGLRMLVIKLTESVSTSWGCNLIALMYIFIMGISLGVLYIKLPETKDETLQEIEKHFRKGNLLFNTQSHANNLGIELGESNAEL